MRMILSALLQAAAPTTGAEVLAAMHDRWAGKWITTMTFVQRTVFPKRPEQIWYESVSLPGKLRIDFGPADSGNAAIMANDSAYQYHNGKLVSTRPYPNTLGTLLADVYAQPVAATVRSLETDGFDLSKVRPDTWEGRPVWVIGAARGDSTSAQFWIDQADLYLVRTIEPAGGVGGPIDGRVTRRRDGPIPVETEMLFFRDGKEMQREYYTDVRLDPALEPWVFERGEYRRPGWIASARTPSR